jgi:hypothetical protein
VEPQCDQYNRSSSRILPPSSCQTGAPSTLPRMSQSAESMPAIAFQAMPPVWRTDMACSSHQISSACIGSRPTIVSASRSTIVTMGFGEPQSVQSPQPTTPSSLVSILTKVHGRKPPSTMKVRTLVIRSDMGPPDERSGVSSRDRCVMSWRLPLTQM